MTKNRFVEKFKSKSNSELEVIAMNSSSFVFDARYAAVALLKDRNYDSNIIEQLERESEMLKKAQSKKTENLKQEDQRLIRRMKQIPIKGSRQYGLKNGNELQVKRLNEHTFQVRIEDHFRSALAPVIICKIKDDSSYLCYPFLYLKPIFEYGIGGVVLTILLSWLGYVKNDILIFVVPLIVTIGLQFLLMPFFYLIILNFLRKRLRGK